MATKSFAASKTMWGLAIAAVPIIAKLFGYDLTPDDMVALNDGVGLLGQIVELTMQLGGLLFAAYGRIKADSKLKMV